MIGNFNKIKLLTIILIILILINIITSIIIFADIQIIQAPRTDVEINIVDINSNFITIEIQMDMYNPNNFEISIEDFKIMTKSEEDIVAELNISGGNISPNNTKNFVIIDQIKFKENSDIKTLNNKITGKIGIKLLGIITKTIPIELNIITSIDEIIDKIKLPEFNLDFEFDELFEEGLNFNIGVNVYNPNNISITINELTFNAINDNNEIVGSFNISGAEIKPKDQSNISTNGFLKYEILDALELNLILDGNMSIKIGGLNKSLSFGTSMRVILPDIKEYFFDNENIKFYIPVQFKITLQGIKAKIGFKYYNPTNITLITKNIICSINRIDGENKTQLGIKSMDSCVVNPKQEACVITEILIPYIEYLSLGNWKVIPDWLVITIEGDLSIEGTRQVVPLSLNAYVSLNLFKEQEFTE